MGSVSATALFCEDIRREVGGRVTLVGIMPDFVSFPKFPAPLRRLTAYFRFKFDTDGNYEEPISIGVELDGVPVETAAPSGAMPRKMIQEAQARAKEKNVPLFTLMGRVFMREPLPTLQKPSQMLAILNVGTERMVCGALAFVEEAPSRSFSKPQPSKAD
jgi:hypothetical protein